MEKKNEVFAVSFTSKPDISWLEYAEKLKQEAPKRVEEAAKYLSGAISISFSIFLQSNSDAFKGLGNNPLLLVAIFLWIFSLVSTLLTIVPFKYDYTNASSIEAMTLKATNLKYRWLKIGIYAFIAALALMGYLYYENNILIKPQNELPKKVEHLPSMVSPPKR